MKRNLWAIVFVVLLVACTGGNSPYPNRDDPPPIPAYPQAQNETAQWSRDDNRSFTRSFETADSPETIYAFYSSQLAIGEDHWLPYRESRGNGQVVTFPNLYTAPGCPHSYDLTVTAEQLSPGTTSN
ncbi:MAG: hypothetical protein ACTHMA_18285, partial [Thermomicrobiales bacterium]